MGWRYTYLLVSSVSKRFAFVIDIENEFVYFFNIIKVFHIFPSYIFIIINNPVILLIKYLLITTNTNW